jgi:cysteinyl-tRNA synthetase
MRIDIPAAIHDLAQARSVARENRDWAEADRLRAEIEAAGWKVVDRGTRFRLERAGPPDVAVGERIRYGRSGSVPSRLDEPASVVATVVLRATDAADDLVRVLHQLGQHVPAETQVIVVANGPDQAVAEALESPDGPASQPVAGEPPEVVWMIERLGPAAAANAGLRRAMGAVVILLDPSIELNGDVLTPLVGALDDPSVAVAGPWGSVSTDLRRWHEAPPGDVDTIDAALMAFRRADVEARGPLDERLTTDRHLGTWWSLVLRDEGDDEEPRRAVRLDGLPVDRQDRPEDPTAISNDQARREKRDFYRVIDRFGRRRDLLVANRVARGSVTA